MSVCPISLEAIPEGAAFDLGGGTSFDIRSVLDLALVQGAAAAHPYTRQPLDADTLRRIHAAALAFPETRAKLAERGLESEEAYAAHLARAAFGARAEMDHHSLVQLVDTAWASVMDRAVQVGSVNANDIWDVLDVANMVYRSPEATRHHLLGRIESRYEASTNVDELARLHGLGRVLTDMVAQHAAASRRGPLFVPAAARMPYSIGPVIERSPPAFYGWSNAERSDGVASDPERGTPTGSRRSEGSPSEGVQGASDVAADPLSLGAPPGARFASERSEGGRFASERSEGGRFASERSEGGRLQSLFGPARTLLAGTTLSADDGADVYESLLRALDEIAERMDQMRTEAAGTGANERGSGDAEGAGRRSLGHSEGAGRIAHPPSGSGNPAENRGPSASVGPLAIALRGDRHDRRRADSVGAPRRPSSSPAGTGPGAGAGTAAPAGGAAAAAVFSFVIRGDGNMDVERASEDDDGNVASPSPSSARTGTGEAGRQGAAGWAEAARSEAERVPPAANPAASFASLGGEPASFASLGGEPAAAANPAAPPPALIAPPEPLRAPERPAEAAWVMTVVNCLLAADHTTLPEHAQAFLRARLRRETEAAAARMLAPSSRPGAGGGGAASSGPPVTAAAARELMMATIRDARDAVRADPGAAAERDSFALRARSPPTGQAAAEASAADRNAEMLMQIADEVIAGLVRPAGSEAVLQPAAAEASSTPPRPATPQSTASRTE
jgi:hypothetical protein